MSNAFLEEVWSQNLVHLLVSPLRPGEFVTALGEAAAWPMPGSSRPEATVTSTCFGPSSASLTVAWPVSTSWSAWC